MSPRLLCAAIVSGCLALAGCGPDYPETVPVQGVVTLSGAPVEGAAVMFMPIGGGNPGRATTAADGTFTIQTFQGEDGARPGKYQVIIKKSQLTGQGAENAEGLESGLGSGPVAEVNELPEQYASPMTTPLTVDVAHEMELPVKFELVK